MVDEFDVDTEAKYLHHSYGTKIGLPKMFTSMAQVDVERLRSRGQLRQSLDNIRRETRLHTDESRLYTFVGGEFKAHETVTHSHDEYVRGYFS